MSARTSSVSRARISASRIREAIAHDLDQIKREDGLTYDDIGRILGKSADMAARYCDGTASMSAETYVFAQEAWNGRFTGRIEAMLAGRPDATCDQTKQSLLLRAALTLSQALEDGEVDDGEIIANRKTLETARDAIAALLTRVGPRRQA